MIIHINTYQIIATSVLLLGSTLIFPLHANAQQVGISVSPSLLQIRTPDLKPIQAPIMLTNLTETETTYTLELQPITADKTGQTRFASQSDADGTRFQSLINQIQVTENEVPIDQITLGPRQKKQLALIITPQEKDKAQDYYFSLVFVSESIYQEVHQEDENKAIGIVNTGIALPILLAVQQFETPKVSLTAFTTQTLRTDGPVPFTIQLKNHSDTFVTAQGSLAIKNMFGQHIGQIEIPHTPLLKKQERVFFTKEHTSSFEPDTTAYTLTWPETVIFGGHTANLDLTIHTTNTVGMKIRDSISFYAFPIKSLGVIAFLLLMAGYAVYRFRKLNR